MFRLASLLVCTLFLGGCFHVQLNGAVAAAEVTVAPLGQPQQVFNRLYSHDPSSMLAWKGHDHWDAYNDYQKTAWMGVVFLPAEPLDAQALYLVTARGGEDIDSDRNLVMDEAAVRIRGEWHAVVPGERFRELRNSVSLLTEACYQWLLHQHGGGLPDARQIRRELDAAAARMVEDVNGDGAVDYNDVLAWNIYTDAQRYRGEAADLQELAMLVSMGFPREYIVRAALRVVAMSPVEEPPEPGLLDYLRKRLRS